ncbi:MAG TPA: sensor histidine kinase, partial [Arcobacter sp.]|nr:sensor histidine kinase [Arcobacter sp.]
MRLLIISLVFIVTNIFAINTKNVLILNSYHKGFEVSDTIIKNIETKFYSNKDINVDILYMDAKQIYSRDYIKQLSDLYSLQLKNRTYNLVITIDRFAYKFAVKNYSKIFTNEKLLFTGVEQFSHELAKVYGLENKIFGIIQKLQIKDNINLILKTMPNIKKLYILNDRSPSGNDSSSFILKQIKQMK